MKNLLVNTLLLVGTLFFLGCSADYQMIQDRELRVVVDSYVQVKKLDKLDVLVALDTSGSMRDNYDDVADGMEILRSDIESLTLDYRFGYITMDPTNLSYVGHYDASSTVIDMLMAPSLLNSTFYEEGFAATYTFFTAPELYEFRRPEADFLLFLISDEDEQSGISAELFYDWMHDEFKDVNHDVVSIVNPDDGSTTWGHEIGYKYIELSNLYGKDALDIKAEDWSVWLSDSSYLTSLKDYVLLSEKDPILESIVVYVNQEAVYDWVYLEETSTIKLGFTPDYGSIIEVGYNVYAE